MKNYMGRKKSRRLLSLIACFCILISSISFLGHPQPAFGAQIISGTFCYDIADSILSLVNTERSNHGLAPVSLDADLQSAAMLRAAEISFDYNGQHLRPSGAEWYTVCDKTYAENIAMGYGNAVAVMNAWMNSTGHRGNILNPEYKSIGIGVILVGGSLFYTQEFGYFDNSLGSPVTSVQVNASVDVMGTTAVTAASFNPASGAGGAQPTTAPTTAAPTTAAPTTAPTTAAPTTAPTTVAPTTAAPTTAAPTTVAPTTQAPTTAAPTIVSISASLKLSSYPIGYQLSVSDFNVVANMSDGTTTPISNWNANHITVDGKTDITILSGSFSTVIPASTIGTYVPETTTVAPTTQAPTTAPTTQAPTTAPTTAPVTTEAVTTTDTDDTTEEDTPDASTTVANETEPVSTIIKTDFITSEHETIEFKEDTVIKPIISIDLSDSTTANNITSFGITKEGDASTLCITIGENTYPLSEDDLSLFLNDNELIDLMVENSEIIAASSDDYDKDNTVSHTIGNRKLDFVINKDGNAEVYITDKDKSVRRVRLSKVNKILGDRANALITTEAASEETIETESTEDVTETEAPTTEETLAENTEALEETGLSEAEVSQPETTSENNNDTNNTMKSLFIAMIAAVSALTVAIIGLIVVLVKKGKKDNQNSAKE